MYRVFNMGIGLILVVPASAAQAVVARATALGDPASDQDIVVINRQRRHWWSMSPTKRTDALQSPCWHPGADQIFRRSSTRSKRGRVQAKIVAVISSTRALVSEPADSSAFFVDPNSMQEDLMVVGSTIASYSMCFKRHDVELVFRGRVP